MPNIDSKKHRMAEASANPDLAAQVAMILSLCQIHDARMSGLKEEIRTEVDLALNEKMND